MPEEKSNIDLVVEAEINLQKASIQKQLYLQKAFNSGNVDEIYKAQRILQNSIESRESVDTKSLFLDPQNFSAGGYKEKVSQLSYDILRNMARVPIIKAIIGTRTEQVIDFTEPQRDKYSTGFVIRPKKRLGDEQKKDLSTAQQKRIEYLTEFILNCGENQHKYHGDTFQSFTRKVIPDSLTIDQGVFETVRNRRGLPVEFFACDGTTYRIAETFNKEDDAVYKDKLVSGYLPHYVQVYNSVIRAEFYPWELCFGIRNPQNSIYLNGYGRSELEDLMETVTSMLNTSQYNSNYFKVGSNPKGILRVNGNVNASRIEELRNHWQADVAGSRNAHKMLIMESDKMDFIPTQQSNKDMEWGKYQEFLTKIACAIYKIDPAEIGFPLEGSSESKQIFGSQGNEEKIKYSKDKGLKPLLKQYQSWLNAFIIDPLDNNYELTFVGIDAETPQAELENDIKSVQNWMTVNEVRTKRGLEPIPGGDIILNPIFMQVKQMEMMGNNQSNQAVQEQQDDNNYNDDNEEEDKNPFTKSLKKEIEDLFAA